MSDILELQKKELKAKQLEFKRLALSSYGSYLEELHKMASRDPSRAQYSAYLVEEMERNNLEIKSIDDQLL